MNGARFTCGIIQLELLSVLLFMFNLYFCIPCCHFGYIFCEPLPNVNVSLRRSCLGRTTFGNLGISIRRFFVSCPPRVSKRTVAIVLVETTSKLINLFQATVNPVFGSNGPSGRVHFEGFSDTLIITFFWTKLYPPIVQHSSVFLFV